MSEVDHSIQRIMVRQNHANDYIIRLARDISEPDDFADEFQLLAGAGPQDSIKLQIVSGGGSVNTCHMIRKAMDECEAKIIGWIGPTCASAAGAIALACDEWEVDDMSSLMVHTGSFSPGWGKSQDVVAAATHQDLMVTKFIRTTYTGFLTEEEILQVIAGKEFWFEGEELCERLAAYAAYRDEARAAMLASLRQQLDDVQETVQKLQEAAPEKVEAETVKAIKPAKEKPLAKRKPKV